MGTSPPPLPVQATTWRCRRPRSSPSLAVKKGSLSWGCLPAGLRGLSGVFPLPFLRRRAVVPPLPLLPVSASSRAILEEASPSKSFRRVSTRDAPGGVSRRSLASASSIAAAVAAAARASASSRARAASASRACCSRAFCASNAASSASVLAFSSATFRRAASMASFLAASSWALAVASAWALSSASLFALSGQAPLPAPSPRPPCRQWPPASGGLPRRLPPTHR